MNDLDRPLLHGVHHTARPTWKLEKTVHFYRDVLGLPLLHCIAARGWGPDAHPDFMHFFFDAGNGATIAFFCYLGEQEPPADMRAPARLHHERATHTAWSCGTREELLRWKQRLVDQGVEVIYHIAHEVVESIYFQDPNGYYLEIGYPIRPFNAIDASDSALSIQAAIEIDRAMRAAGSCVQDIVGVWARKGELVERHLAGGA